VLGDGAAFGFRAAGEQGAQPLREPAHVARVQRVPAFRGALARSPAGGLEPLVLSWRSVSCRRAYFGAVVVYSTSLTTPWSSSEHEGVCVGFPELSPASAPDGDQRDREHPRDAADSPGHYVIALPATARDRDPGRWHCA
jgi:hypothetical protein